MRRLMLLGSLSLVSVSLPAQSCEITHTCNVGGEGGWDHVIPRPAQPPDIHRPPESGDGGRS